MRSEVELAAGDLLFKEGDVGNDLYVLLEGAVEVLLGDRCVATIDEEGAFLGELSALLGTRRTATLRAIAPTSCLRFAGDLDESFFSEPALAAKLARTLAKRLHEADLNLRELQARG